MKLCFIATQGGEYGGSEVLWYMTAKEALLGGINVLISIHDSYLEHAQLKDLVRLGGRLHIREDNNLSSFYQKLRFKIKYNVPELNLYKEVKDFQPDLIIVSQRGTYDAASQIMLYKFLTKSRLPFLLISQFHKENKSDIEDDAKRRAIALFKAAVRIYFVSNRNKVSSEATLGFKFSNAAVINNPMKVKMEDIAWPPEDVFNIACVARINYNVKRQQVLVKVLSDKKWRHRKVKLNFYGEGPDTPKLQQLIQDMKLEHKIQMYGQVDDIKKVWQQNHMFILPSVAEGLPLALIEANLLGRPAITTKVGDNDRLVRHNETGFLIENFSEQALENTLEAAWEKRNQWQEMGTKARAHALKELDINIHKTLLSHIISLVNEKSTC